MIDLQVERLDYLLAKVTHTKSNKSGQSWLQTKVNDSATVRCLVAIISMLDNKIEPRTIYEAIPYIKNGQLEYIDMISAMANLGYESYKINSPVGKIDKRLFPCAFTTKNNDNYVILDIEDNKNVSVYDCSDKTIKSLPQKKLSSGFATIFKKRKKTEENGKKQEKPFSQLISAFGPQFKSVMVAGFFLNIFTLSMPIFVMVVYDKVIGTQQENTLYYLTVGIAIAFFAEIMLRVLRGISICWIGSRIDNLASNKLFKKIIYMETSFTENASISSQVSKIKSLESIRNFFTSSLFTTVIDIPFAVIMLIAIALISGWVVVVPIIAIMVNIALMLILGRKIKAATAISSKEESLKQEMLLESFSKVNFFRYNGMTDTWIDKVRDVSASASTSSFKSTFAVNLLETLTAAVTSITVIATVVVGTNLIWANQITIGALVATMIIIWRLLAPIQTLCSILPKLQQIKSSIEQLNRIMKAKSESEESLSSKPLANIEGRVELINVGIRYNQNTSPVFSSLSIEAKPGELIAICGDNGSGKTTILKLINKLYSPQIGSIRIDDMDIRQINPLDLRHYVDYLPQTPVLFDGTIRDNLLLANPMASSDELENALKEVDALDDINALNDKIDSKIGGNNPPISTSLAYQINIARALLKESNILLLDELPFSVLNSKSGFAYMNLITSLKGKKTIFFITHREDHMKLADKIIILKKEQSPVIMG